MLYLVAATLAWGLLAFGAVYPWAYWPLIALAALCIASCAVAGPRARVRNLYILPAGLLLIPLAIQLAPISGRLVTAVAPANAHVFRALRFGLSPETGLLTLSVDPGVTAITVVFIALGTAWAAAISRLGRSRPDVVAQLGAAVLCLATLVSLLALIQKAAFNGKIYWFWKPESNVTSNYYGPFVNRNHFAGWGVLSLGVGMGYIAGAFSCARRHWPESARRRILWLSTPEASTVVIGCSAMAVVVVAQIWSLSRSGIAATALASLVFAGTAARNKNQPVALLAAGALVIAMLWKGTDSIANWYGHTESLRFRIALWRDSLPALKQFWGFGSGLNTYGQVMLLFQQTDPRVHAQQAHNDYLQLAIEGGLLVIIPWTIAAVLLIRRIIQRLRQPQDEMTWWIRMGAVAGICGIALQETTDFSLQIPAVALLFATVVGIAIHEPAPINEPVRRRRRDAARAQSPGLITASRGG